MIRNARRLELSTGKWFFTLDEKWLLYAPGRQKFSHTIIAHNEGNYNTIFHRRMSPPFFSLVFRLTYTSKNKRQHILTVDYMRKKKTQCCSTRNTHNLWPKDYTFCSQHTRVKISIRRITRPYRYQRLNNTNRNHPSASSHSRIPLLYIRTSLRLCNVATLQRNC